MSTPFAPLDARAAARQRTENLFYEALELPKSEREAFLIQVCGEDASMRAEVEGYLRSHEQAGAFLEENALAAVEMGGQFAFLKNEGAGDRIGPYKLLEQIGEGGFGRVWVGEQERPIRRRVALKVIKVGMDTKDVVARFEQERQALAMMEHPNIAKVFDAGSTPTGRPYFVMELVKGVRITEYCDEAYLSTTERLRLFMQVCSAVQHAHQKGIIHRDLKPSNILVTLHDGIPMPKVIDFGVAKATQQQRLSDLTVYTRFEQIIGTPLYMAPEQAEMSGLDVDTRSDIYSLGVLLYELLTGRTPFEPEKLLRAGYDEMRRVIREEEPLKPSTVVSTMAQERRTLVAKQRSAEGAKLINLIRGDLDWIVMKALEKDRNRRYESASSFARDIERHLSSKPVLARPPSVGYRFRRFVGRNRGPVTAGVAVAFALIIGVAGIAWQAVRADREAKKANAALIDLRGSAPAFIEQARSLVTKARFDEAIEKLDYAIQLRPDVAEYLLAKADLLQCEFRFDEAEKNYVAALHLKTDDKRAKDNAQLCSDLAREIKVARKLSIESLSKLLSTMKAEQRSAAEMMRVGKLLGEESNLLLSYWLERLKDLPIPPDQPLDKRLTVVESGRLSLDLNYTGVANLSPLEGMPLGRINLTGCGNVSDLTPLRGMPLRSLFLEKTNVTDLSPLSSLKSLTALLLNDSNVVDLSPLRGLPLKLLGISRTQVTDLTPLQGMPLEALELNKTRVSDLTPLRGMSLRSLDIANTSVGDLEPLRGIPLHILSCGRIAARDFLPIASAPLEDLNLSQTHVEDISFLRNMPLTTLLLSGCNSASGFKVLSEIKSLEVILLPSKIAEQSEEEMNAIETLRSHPKLRQIQIGSVQGTRANAFLPKAEFWKDFERDLKTWKALKQVVGGEASVSRNGDRSWAVSFAGQPVSDLTPLRGMNISQLSLQGTNVVDLAPLKEMPLEVLNLKNTAVSDLAPLQGAPITGLDLYGTNVADLTPLKGMPITQLLAQRTDVTDLTPLKDLPLRELLLDGCPPNVDLTPLSRIKTLRLTTLPPKPQSVETLRSLPNLKYISYRYDGTQRRPAHTAEEFWSGRRTFSAETLVRERRFTAAESLLRKEARKDSEAGFMAWLSLGTVVFAQGDKARYQAFCREIMMHTADGRGLGITVKLCLLGTDSGISLKELEKLMDRDLESGLGWRLLNQGLLEYRAARYENGVRILRHIRPNACPMFGGSPAASAILSMCYFRQGNLEAAEAELNIARQEITPYWPGGAVRTDTEWWDCLIAYLLLQEAEKLIGSAVAVQWEK